MPTGACGINCDVCRLNLLGICSTCGGGTSQEGLKKMETQLRVLGSPCPILACALETRIAYCPRDCDVFPCDKFTAGPYPYSKGFLSMQERRRTQNPQPKTPSGDIIKVPGQYWEDLRMRDLEQLCEFASARNYPPTGLLLPFLKEYLLVDTENRCLCRQSHGQWERMENPLLELVCLVYLLNVGPQPLSHELVSVKELKSGHFFTGPHELRIQPLLHFYGNDLERFKEAAEGARGEVLDLADAAYMFQAFPKVPLYYLLWQGDEEFQPRLSILFDRSIEHHLAADAIWGLVNLVSDVLLSFSFASTSEPDQ
jgi:hypothetical protein